MKKIISVILVAFMVMASLVGCGGVDEGGKANLGDYNVVIESVRYSKSYKEEPVVIVKYTFTNYEEDENSFYLSIIDNVYQGGIELDFCYSVDSSANYSTDNQSKKVKTGESIVVERAYVLRDITTPIKVEVSEAFSFSDAKVSKTFSLDGSNLESIITPKGNLGNYNVVIDSVRISKDYNNKPVVIVKYLFTNYNDEEESFMVATNVSVYQNGVELSGAILVDSSANYSSENQMKKIKTGITLAVEDAYVLNNSTSPIEVEVKALFDSVSGRKVTKVFNIK